MLAFALLAPLAAKFAAGPISSLARRHEAPALLLILVVSTVLGFSALAHAMGAPVILGGFAAGLALGRGFRVHVPSSIRLPFGKTLRRLLAVDPDFSHVVETHTRPLVHLFAPVFFVLVGVSLDLRSVNWADPKVATLLATLVTVALAGSADYRACNSTPSAWPWEGAANGRRHMIRTPPTWLRFRHERHHGVAAS